MLRASVIACVACACGGSSSGDDEPTCSLLEPTSIVLLDAADSIPAGWACISCADGDPFFARFPRAATTTGELGGTPSHDHAFMAMQMGSSSSIVAIDNTQGTVAVTSGMHPMATGSTSMADHLPRYRDMKLIAPIAVSNVLPVGAIVLLDAADIPTGFARYFAQDNTFVRGSGSPGMGGSGDHRHTFSGMLAAPNSVLRPAAAERNAASATHVHVFGGDSGTFSNDPRHAVFVLARATEDVAPPLGAIVMFEQTPSAAWRVRTDLDGAFLRADALPVMTLAGDDMHGGEITVISTAASAGVQVAAGMTNVGSGTHTHQVRVALARVDHRPPYRDVLLAQRVGECP